MKITVSFKLLFIIVAAVIAGIIAIIWVCHLFAWKEQIIKLNPSYNELFTETELKEKGHKSIIPEYSNDVSIGFNNNDGTKSLYIYASPIRFQNNSGQLSIIDTRIANIRDTSMREIGYIYTIANSDIEPFFPKEITNNSGILIKKDIEYSFGVKSDKPILGWYEQIKNFIGDDKYMISYDNAFGNETQLNFYPSSLGVNCEVNFTSKPAKSAMTFWLNIPDEEVKVKKEPGGYFILTKDRKDDKGATVTDILAVIQKPLLKTEEGKISYNCSIEYTTTAKGQYEITFLFDKDTLSRNTTAFISFEMRREKQPDNALYSKHPDLTNAYLLNYSIVGNSSDYGIGRVLIRYKFAKLFNLKSTLIKEANYYTSNFSENNDKLELVSVLEDWCSITGNWNKNYKTGGGISHIKATQGVLKFNITEEVKKWCDNEDGQMEHNGIQLKSTDEKEGVFNLIASNDCSLYRVRTEVVLNN